MALRWQDERYVRVYTRDTADWLSLSFLAQGLFVLLLRKVDRAGILPLGRQGKKGAVVAIGHAHEWNRLGSSRRRCPSPPRPGAGRAAVGATRAHVPQDEAGSVTRSIQLAVGASSDADLPQLYVAAVSAISACERVDECATWAKKAAAMASYAKQSKDDTMEMAARRIRGRAVRRLGELAREIPAKAGGRGDPSTRSAGGTPPHLSERAKALRAAGVSPDEAKTAMRVANVPPEEFEAAIESQRPPTVDELAERGTQKRKPLIDLQGLDPDEYNRALHVRAAINALADTLDQVRPEAFVRGTLPQDFGRLKLSGVRIVNWLSQMVQAMPKEKP